MRYIYIICLLMSSFFTYKNSFATEDYPKYAFFVPQNAFQENLSVQDINNMKPRYDKKETHPQKTGTISKAEKAKISHPYVRKPLVFEEAKAKKDSTEQKAEKVEVIEKTVTPAPIVDSVKPVEQVEVKPVVAPTAPKISEEMQKKLNQYILDDDFSSDMVDETPPSPDQKEIMKSEISNMLASIPYADRKQPKFQQAYGDYGSDLRILFHRGKFPNNYKQEELLSKVNSSHRFKVE